MSVTTTSNTTTQSVLKVLADYELTHSGNDTDGTVEAPNPRLVDQETRQNPDWWTRDYNGVPPYRPINYDLDHELRPWARPGIETAFVWTMLNGVGVVAATARLWRNTGGRLNDTIFRFSIGGER
ncbi:hypothetical protein H2198_007101 [Neophaeococcomyces mojaviensis]|uniref:Uncharacterized protein n=1 Tax=Neophaeococcomyces mojaviensis TaxID=3383035 RepID=A0ACC3A135_9EURO|nr:hypothetical protein H2198_007101 [Knufia sp. JES_112]